MSEIPAGSMSLEDDTPLSEVVTPPEPVETPAPPVQAAEDEPEGTIVNPGGEKLVPLGALAGAREKARQANEAREALEAELATLRPKAALADQIKGEWDAVQPMIQSVRNGTYQPAKPAEKPAGPLSEQEAVEYAKDLDLYKADGTPDVARAQRLAARQEALAARSAQALVAPLHQQSAQQQSAANLATVSTWKDPTGAQVDQGILREVWNLMPAEMTAQPNIARVMYSVALGEMMLRGKHKIPTQPPPPPLQTESLGGGNTARAELSNQERGFIEAVGMKAKEYEETSARFKPGERNSLE